MCGYVLLLGQKCAIVLCERFEDDEKRCRNREIDFVIQHGDNAVPVEVKAGGDKRASSFKGYVNSRKPKFAIRFSERNLKKDGAFVNIPLYLAPRFAACLK